MKAVSFLVLFAVLAPLCLAIGCTDSDGSNIYTAGVCTQPHGEVYRDVCTTAANTGGPAVIEYICAGTVCQAATRACETGYCFEGACQKYPPSPSFTPTEQPTFAPTVYASPSQQAEVIRMATPAVYVRDEGVPIDLNQVLLVVCGAALLVAVAWLASRRMGGKKEKAGKKGRPRKKK